MLWLLAALSVVTICWGIAHRLKAVSPAASCIGERCSCRLDGRALTLPAAACRGTNKRSANHCHQEFPTDSSNVTPSWQRTGFSNKPPPKPPNSVQPSALRCVEHLETPTSALAWIAVLLVRNRLCVKVGARRDLIDLESFETRLDCDSRRQTAARSVRLTRWPDRDAVATESNRGHGCPATQYHWSNEDRNQDDRRRPWPTAREQAASHGGRYLHPARSSTRRSVARHRRVDA